MSKVTDMSADERKALVEKLGQCIKDAGLADKVKVKTYRETVCALAADKMEDKFQISVDGTLGPEMKESVDKLKETADPLVKDVEGASFAVKVQLGPGCQYDPIKNVVPIKGGDPVTLEHKEGEVWMIDFWATWCPPCQAPMAHNEEMLKKRGEEWGDKVKIICISIDQTADKVVSHCDAKDWNRPTHYHRAGSDCSTQYAVSGVPNVMIIDTKGKIAFKGHPANRKNLEEDFDNLLKGETITGPGTEPAAAPKEEGGEEGGKKDLDSSKCLETIDTFAKEIGPAMQKDEDLKESAKKMPRAFCVMVYTESYDPSSGESKIEFQNYRVLVGPQDAIDKCKSAIEEKVKGDFEIVLREQAM